MTVFALDIGTRKVTGIIGYMDEDEILHVLDFETIEHPYRYMLDGQIHNIEGVAKVISTIKKRLEERNEVKLEEVAVAVAGRFLKTVTCELEMDVPMDFVDSDFVKQLELLALSKIPLSDQDGLELQCVGYSAVEYKLDGLWMKSLVGHRGKKAYVKVVAALLPNQVVDAMISTLKKVGLKPTFMTLEPIAALEITVPEDLRILNIALVDIGAGTSDIAISKAGFIVGYEMVPMAGDEITEALAQNYLLDFQAAEQLKRNLDSFESVETVTVTDKKVKIDREEAFKVIKPTVEVIAKQIAEKIVKLNNGSPSVVFLVGGGSKLSILRKELANCLQIPEERVSLKSVEQIQKVKSHKQGFVGSEYVTVSGIAYMAASGSGSIYDMVEINGQKVKLLRIGQGQTVLHALLQNGFNLSEIFGDFKPPITFKLNGEIITIPQRKLGGLKVFVNGVETPLYRRLKTGDVVITEKNNTEDDEQVLLSRYVKPYVAIVDGKEFAIVTPKVYVNGQVLEDLNYQIQEGDIVEVEKMDATELMKRFEENLQVVQFYLNGEKKQVKKHKLRLVEVKEDESQIKVIFQTEPVKIQDVIEDSKPIKIKLNGEEIILNRKNNLVVVNGNYVPVETPLEEGMEILFEPYKPIVADVLTMLNINPRRIKNYTLLVNGQKASFVQELKEGDEVTFQFEEKTED
ncbi:cell division protein FtsA [Pseudothermotoga thermarum]|uniref:Cell division protein FtsA n=1 Tax=Pseudothermotoga thermarum DSM 5069 TaxID=688269 RepID=F7YX96_9THEM|nr:cell division protein FtsA [Pseudothermotoga thermarum]AEH51299.1 cell division protein FtsA [Pseudothermotoga thermarum DSM 5069]